MTAESISNGDKEKRRREKERRRIVVEGSINHMVKNATKLHSLIEDKYPELSFIVVDLYLTSLSLSSELRRYYKLKTITKEELLWVEGEE